MAVIESKRDHPGVAARGPVQVGAPGPIPVAVPETCGPVALPLGAILRELRGAVASLDVGQYCQPMGPVFSDGKIGSHVRHCLDHVRALVNGFGTGTIDYDHRARGTNIEGDPVAGVAELTRLIDALERLAGTGADAPVRVAIMPGRDGAAVSLGSTLGREMAFVLSHTVHHNALMRGMFVAAGLAVPAAFGYAPSTLAFQDSAEQVADPAKSGSGASR